MMRFDRRSKIPTWIGAIVLAGVLASCGLPDTTDTTAPTVLETTPSSGAIAPTNEPVTATFDEAIDVATLNTSSFTLTSPGSMLVAGSVSFDAATNTAIFTPTNALAFDTTYTATLSTDVTDVAGNALDQPYSWTFTTEDGPPDTSAPTVLATKPTDGAMAPTDQPVTARFDEALDVSTLTTSSFMLTGPGGTPVAGSVSFNATTNTAIFTPTTSLADNTSYTATLSTAITDVAGNALTDAVTWTFTTDDGAPDTSAPTVLATKPSSGGTAPTDQPVTVTFDEALDVSTLTTSSFTLTGPGGTPVAGSVSFDAATNTAIFTPTNPLAFDTTYTATLSTDITDVAGNALTDVITWTFTTSIEAVDLGTAGVFVLLSKAGISATVGTSITGDIGVSPIALTAITGFDYAVDASNTFATSSMVVGKIYAASLAEPTPTMLTTAIGDLEIAYTDAAGRTMPKATELGAGQIGGLDLEPGLYTWSTGVDINTDLTLTGSATDVWILQIAQDLTLANGVSVLLAGGALPENVFWQVAGKVTLGTTSVVHGVVLSKTAIVMKTGATLIGRGYAQTEITLDAATVTQP